jgi:ornithine cyclodeaminase
VLDYGALIDALSAALCADITVAKTATYRIPLPSAGATTLALTPAWTGDGARFIGCRLAAAASGNTARGKRAESSSYMLLSADTAETLAIMDGEALTLWRAAATSALAARHLARDDASHLVMIGTGALCPHLVRAYRAVRPIARVTLWSRSRSRAVATAFALSAAGIEPTIADDLQEAVGEADIVSCATRSPLPLLRGAWLKKGMHVDLAGSLAPNAREADDAAIKRARVYVDSRVSAPKASGDIAAPLKKKIIGLADIQGDLFELCGGKTKGRKRKDDITLFKSAGLALGDLVTAMLVWRALAAPRQGDKSRAMAG